MQNQEEVNVPLFEAPITMLKSIGEDGNIKFGGVASSEDFDEDGEIILRKHLDITYISKKGYVNWDHSRTPENQLGFITKAVIIPQSDIPMYEDKLQTTLAKSASLYVEGKLYDTPQANHVGKILKSIPAGTEGAMGLSVEGGVLRKDGDIQKALVRGVAITPAPVQSETLCRLIKSLGLDVSTSVEGVVVADTLVKGLSESEAVIKVMELRPQYPLDLAKKIVRHLFSKLGGN